MTATPKSDRATLEKRLDRAVDRALQCRIALRAAEREMRDAREALDKFDAEHPPEEPGQ